MDHAAIPVDNATALAIFYQSHPVPQHFNAGIVIASIIVSVLGSYTTLLLLGRRTATAGIRNWVLLLLAATTMASVGIWSMHFLGMNMALAASPQITWYIQFSPWFTVLSLFAPLIALVLAFVFVGAGPESMAIPEPNCSDVSLSSVRSVLEAIGLRLVVGGMLFGGTVALMHYCAAFSASFNPVYHPLETASAIVLACVASTAALLVFFRLQSQWQDNWWKRLLCAVALSSAVCGMHYVGLSGTRWYVPAGKTTDLSLGKKNSTILSIAISLMCFALCIICFITLLSDFLMRKHSRRNAKRVVIASATFDKAGRLLVQADGLLPISVIETSMPLKDILTELDYRQPTFQWLYTLSWDWTILEPFMPRIVARSLGLTTFKKNPLTRRYTRSREPGSSFTASKNTAQMTQFRDRCIEATQTLAHDLNLPMTKMGVFFDNVLRTGTRTLPHDAAQAKRRRKSGVGEKDRGGDEESVWSIAAPPPGHEGIMVFLVRELSGKGPDSHESYARRGYRFADTRYFSAVLADRVAVAKPEIDGLFDQLKLYARRGTKPCVKPGGVYVGFFGVRPSISRQGGLDTLVYSFCHHQCPAYRLPDVESITEEMREWVGRLSGTSIKDVAALCERESMLDADDSGHSDAMAVFLSGFYLGIDAMMTNLQMFPGLETRARLAAEILEVPSSMDDLTEPASMIMFETVLPPPLRHGLEEPGMPKEFQGSFCAEPGASTFVFVPYSLFSKSHMMMLRGTGAHKFAREVRQEMMKRYPISPESLHQIASPEGTGAAGGCARYGLHDIYEKATPARLEAHQARQSNGSLTSHAHSTHKSLTDILDSPRSLPNAPYRGDAAPLSPRTPQASPPRFSPVPDMPAPTLTRSSAHAWGGSGSNGHDAPVPAYSPTQAHQLLGSPIRAVLGRSGEKPIPLSPRRHTIVGAGSQKQTTTTSSGSSGTPDREATVHLQKPRSAGAEVITTVDVKPSAVRARSRAEDWHVRRLDSLERGANGEDLLGVEW